MKSGASKNYKDRTIKRIESAKSVFRLKSLVFSIYRSSKNYKNKSNGDIDDNDNTRNSYYDLEDLDLENFSKKREEERGEDYDLKYDEDEDYDEDYDENEGDRVETPYFKTDSYLTKKPNKKEEDDWDGVSPWADDDEIDLSLDGRQFSDVESLENYILSRLEKTVSHIMLGKLSNLETEELIDFYKKKFS